MPYTSAGPALVGCYDANSDMVIVVPQSFVGASSSSPVITNPCASGVKLFINITALSGTTPSLTVSIQGVDPASGNVVTLASTAAITATGMTTLTLFPGATAVANSVVNDILPRTFQVSLAVAGTTPGITLSIGASLID